MKHHSRRAAARSGVVAFLAAITGLAMAAGIAHAAAPVNYVALGDSYSAASGVLPLDLNAPPECLRSSRNYPHVIAEKTGAKLTDVTCGAADTTHYAGSQYPGVDPQLDALSADTDLVTMTIGGNDSGVFIGAIVKCGSAGTLSLGMGHPCQDQNGSSFEDTIRNTTYPSLVNALNAVHAKAPNARVAILSYPWITPKTDGCFPQMPVAKGDIPYVRSLQTTLNDAVERAANATGSTFVSLNEISEGHDACKPIGTRWVEPVLLGTNPVIVHPNALGESEMAKQTIKVLAKSPDNPLPPVASTPAPKTKLKKASIRKAKGKATFRFKSVPGGSTFRCRLDKQKFKPCRSPKTYRGLKPGRHVFRVKAVNADGRGDLVPAVKKFRIAG